MEETLNLSHHNSLLSFSYTDALAWKQSLKQACDLWCSTKPSLVLRKWSQLSEKLDCSPWLATPAKSNTLGLMLTRLIKLLKMIAWGPRTAFKMFMTCEWFWRPPFFVWEWCKILCSVVFLKLYLNYILSLPPINYRLKSRRWNVSLFSLINDRNGTQPLFCCSTRFSGMIFSCFLHFLRVSLTDASKCIRTKISVCQFACDSFHGPSKVRGLDSYRSLLKRVNMNFQVLLS